MVYEIMARNCSEKNLNAGKIAAILSRAGQIIHRKSIDQREQTGSRRRTPVFSWVDPNWRTYTMATAAQIEANRRNAQRSTGPKTDEGKDRVRRNAFKHGMTARTIMPVLPQEDPKELEDQIQQAITAMKPRNPLELDLVCRAVRLAGELDRAERVATAHLAHRVRMATRSGTDTVSAEELSRVHDLGSKLFFQAAIGPGYSSATADDYPAVIVRRLEEKRRRLPLVARSLGRNTEPSGPRSHLG